jgi:hypothetical protein
VWPANKSTKDDDDDEEEEEEDQPRIITVRLTFLAHSVRMRPNFQGLPSFEGDELGDDKLLIRILLN